MVQKRKTQPEDLGTLGTDVLIDRLGGIKTTLSLLKKSEASIKEVLKSRLRLDEPVLGIDYVGELTVRPRTALNQSGVKEEMGMSWWDDHCETTEVEYLTIAAREF